MRGRGNAGSVVCTVPTAPHSQAGVLRVQGGNDHEIFESERTIGHTVNGPDDTMRQCRELFLS